MNLNHEPPRSPFLREKARMPRAVHGDEWPMQFWGHAPPNRIGFFQAFLTESTEEAPPCERGSSLQAITQTLFPLFYFLIFLFICIL
jgi:hypothetical protein